MAMDAQGSAPSFAAKNTAAPSMTPVTKVTNHTPTSFSARNSSGPATLSAGPVVGIARHVHDEIDRKPGEE
jgi:hypothetical protein